MLFNAWLLSSTLASCSLVVVFSLMAGITVALLLTELSLVAITRFNVIPTLIYIGFANFAI